MNKKIFTGLFVISLIVLAGGCGGSSHSVTSTTDVNAALNGVWVSSINGTATVTITNDDNDALDSLIEAFGEIPDELEEAKKNETVEPINVPVTSAVVLFDDCNVEGNSGTAKLTAIIILGDDSLCLPIFYNGAAVSTQRNNTNEWTATTSDGDTLSIKMASEEKITLSGKVHYLDYVCEFSIVIDKNMPNSINPQEILDGTWKLDAGQGGGYLAVNSIITSAIIPEAVSMYFKDTKQTSSTLTSTLTSFYSLYMKTSNTGTNEEAPVLQTVNLACIETLTQIYGSVYKFTEGNIEGIIFIENTDEMFIFMTEDVNNAWQTCMFLPLKKVSFNLEEAMNKTWTVVDGGGYVENDSFTLGSVSIMFSGVTADTATVNIQASFAETNDTSASTKSRTYNDSVTMKRSGNFLSFEDSDKTAHNIAFISDTEAFLSINNENSSEYFVLRFRATN